MEYLRQKELTPIVYNSGGVKILGPTRLDVASTDSLLHWHDRMELLVVCEGELQVSVGRDRQIVRPGEMAVVNPGQLHGGSSAKDGATYYVVMFETANFFNGTAASHDLIKAIHDRRVSFRNHCADPAILQTVQRIIRYSQSAQPHSGLLVTGAVYELLGQLYESQRLPSVLSTETDTRFSAVMEYINLHFTEDLHCGALSCQFGYDNAYFCRRFKNLTGMTFSRYIRMLRLEYAQQLLSRRELQIRDVAVKCGFADAGYFCRCYKAYYQMSPTEYLAQNA